MVVLMVMMMSAVFMRIFLLLKGHDIVVVFGSEDTAVCASAALVEDFFSLVHCVVQQETFADGVVRSVSLFVSLELFASKGVSFGGHLARRHGSVA